MIPAILRRRRYSLLWLSAILLLGLLLAWLISVPLLRGVPIGRSGTLVGQPAPALEAPDLDGRDWSLADAGGRITWVNFWATSCEPCRTEMPAMERIAEEYADELLVVGVNWGEEAGSVADFARRYGVTYPILLDPGLDIYYDWAGTDGLPRHYFIGESGRSSARSSVRWIRRAWSRSSTSSSPNLPRQRKRGARRAPSSVRDSERVSRRRRRSRSYPGGHRTGSSTYPRQGRGRRSGSSRRDR